MLRACIASAGEGFNLAIFELLVDLESLRSDPEDHDVLSHFDILMMVARMESSVGVTYSVEQPG